MVVSSEKAIKDVLITKQDYFSDRPPSLRSDILTQGCDVIFGNDSNTRYKKKHMMRAIKQSEDQIKHVESMTLSFGTEMLEEMEKHQGNAFDPYNTILLCVGSIVMDMTFGYSTIDDVKTFTQLWADTVKVLEPKGLYLLLDIFPWLRFVLPKFRAIHREVRKYGKDMEKTFRMFTDTTKKRTRTSDSMACIGHFLNLLETQCNSDKRINMLDEKDVIFVGVDYLMAGLGPPSSTLYSLLGILVNHPSVQDRAYSEISRAIGKRHPCIQDQHNLPFLEAIILEAHRYISLFPVLIPHYCSTASKLSGYLIPEGTMILANMWSLHHNEEYWDQPWVFNPDRFLENGSLVPADHIKRQRLLNFGIGRRKCVGDTFAKNRLFLLVTLLLQKFKFLPAEGHPTPRHDPREYDVRLNLLIKPYKLCAQLRN